MPWLRFTPQYGSGDDYDDDTSPSTTPLLSWSEFKEHDQRERIRRYHKQAYYRCSVALEKDSTTTTTTTQSTQEFRSWTGSEEENHIQGVAVPVVKCENKKVLTLDGAVIMQSDCALLRTESFLSDEIIDFYFKYLKSRYEKDDVLFLSPCVSFLLAHTHDLDSLREITKELELDKKELIFLTVNNNNDMSQAGGGTHWSLLVYCRTRHTFIHHDSFKNMNNLHAMRLYKSVRQLVGSGGPARLRRAAMGFDLFPLMPLLSCFEEGATPKQKNGCDCGLYVMRVAEYILDWHKNRCPNEDDTDVSSWFYNLSNEVLNVESSMRNEVLRIIKLLSYVDGDKLA